MKILLTGASGQLGKAFQELFKNENVKYIATDVKELDITNLEQVLLFVKQFKDITHIINCAAYNQVDKAEQDWKSAYLVNGLAVRNLAIAANEINAEIVHYSTDYVFSGNKGEPYTIYDTPDPINKYGQSKVLGERFLTTIAEKWYLIRTSWVFGDGPVNFVKKVIEWSKKTNELRIVDDEVSAPTYAPDLAKATYELIKLKAYGLYHITNTSCSRYEWAEFILKEIGWNGKLLKAKQEDFSLPAKRPTYSVLDNFGYYETVGKTMRDWKEATREYIKFLKMRGEI
ncbi:dTDP-4-dehydrorhamnose reductase [Thermosipho japonicus]|uniref:dTDP-4-dehydrorhamnose reductase n=1 Tax=Thermosipho japonicus TaxID=90323 RepID=A0A841GTS7_9BACT|nr:dTDP-4-dehydrorhamnose reductase [Thermosipho japonicus]MBB6062810.1 dTDP-4-dehydrorhamnose reductase [Thermosipho japonicus]